jgi:hypothetical protein
MPTIEIILLGRNKPIKMQKNKYDFCVKQNTKLISHRALFQEFLDKENGVILHLGNLSLAKESFCFAGELIDWDYEPGIVYLPEYNLDNPIEDQWDGRGQYKRFKFKDQHICGIRDLLLKAQRLSPKNKVLFLTDVQFGPSEGKYIQISDVENLWAMHNGEGLDWNVLYIIG